MTPRLGVSRCLLGEPVRYDARHKRHGFLTDALAPHVEWVGGCPEEELGMGVPREPVVLVGSEPRMVGAESGRDWTEAMVAWARRRVAELPADLCGYVLKSRSPSCGLLGVPRQGAAPGPGLFAAALRTARPDLPLIEETDLDRPAVRDAFLERVFAEARLRDLLAGAEDPLAFHARHRVQLVAHGAGRLTPGAGLEGYAAAVRGALARPVAPRRQRRLAGWLLQRCRADVPLPAEWPALRAAVRAEVRRVDPRGWGQQTWLEPYPASLEPGARPL